jgi:hypothetical protein
VGLLMALPNTQLTRRLLKEGRLLSLGGEIIETEEQFLGYADAKDLVVPTDQTMEGLNFRTQRSRVEILEDLLSVVTTVYEPKSYFDRVLRMTTLLKSSSRHRPRWFEIKRDLLGFVRLASTMTRDKEMRRYFWRNLWAARRMGFAGLGMIMKLMGAYVHFKEHVRDTVEAIKRQTASFAEMDRKLAERDRATGRQEPVSL